MATHVQDKTARIAALEAQLTAPQNAAVDQLAAARQEAEEQLKAQKGEAEEAAEAARAGWERSRQAAEQRHAAQRLQAQKEASEDMAEALRAAAEAASKHLEEQLAAERKAAAVRLAAVQNCMQADRTSDQQRFEARLRAQHEQSESVVAAAWKELADCQTALAAKGAEAQKISKEVRFTDCFVRHSLFY